MSPQTFIMAFKLSRIFLSVRKNYVKTEKVPLQYFNFNYYDLLTSILNFHSKNGELTKFPVYQQVC